MDLGRHALGTRCRRSSGDELRRRRHRTRPAFELADCRRLLPVAARQDPRDPAVHVALERVGMEPAQNLGPSPRRIEHGGGPFTAASRLVWLQSRGGLSPAMWVWNGHDWMAGPYPRPPVAPEAEIIDAADSQFLILGSAIAGVDALAQTLQV